jgi:hypothetical protein
VDGTVVIPARTHTGRYLLELHEKSGCNDNGSCSGGPVGAPVRVG